MAMTRIVHGMAVTRYFVSRQEVTFRTSYSTEDSGIATEISRGQTGSRGFQHCRDAPGLVRNVKRCGSVANAELCAPSSKSICVGSATDGLTRRENERAV